MKENMTSDKRNETIKALDELDKKYFTEINQHELESQIEEIEFEESKVLFKFQNDYDGLVGIQEDTKEQINFLRSFISNQIELRKELAKLKLDIRENITISIDDSIFGKSRHEVTVEGKKIAFRIPPGIKNGTLLKLKGKGKEDKNGIGDLYITIQIPEHEIADSNKEAVEPEIMPSEAESENPKEDFIDAEIDKNHKGKIIIKK